MNKENCSLTEEQMNNGFLCKSMFCEKCKKVRAERKQEKSKLIDLKDFTCILCCNDSTECYLFKSEKEAIKEAKEYLGSSEFPMNEAYILNIKLRKKIKLDLVIEHSK